MLATKPKPIMIIAGLLVLLALLSGTSALTNQIGITRGGQPGTATGNNAAPGGNFQGGNGGNFQGGNAPGGNFQGRGGGNNVFGSIFRTLGPAFGYISTGITILGILLALLCAYGVWKQKRWGLNLAMVLALLFLVAAVPGLFSLGGRNINWLRVGLNILTALASAPILVMGILPSVRDLVP